jgi:hypothetical protein
MFYMQILAKPQAGTANAAHHKDAAPVPLAINWCAQRTAAAPQISMCEINIDFLCTNSRGYAQTGKAVVFSLFGAVIALALADEADNHASANKRSGSHPCYSAVPTESPSGFRPSR